jgi:hypothetical protein
MKNKKNQDATIKKKDPRRKDQNFPRHREKLTKVLEIEK